MAATDDFQEYTVSLDSPGSGGAAVTPDDANDLTKAGRAIDIGTGGTIKVTTIDGSVLTFKNRASGSTLRMRVARVWATGTTATDLTVIW